MAKGQTRGNKEIRKPKQKKAAPAIVATASNRDKPMGIGNLKPKG
jgi:hypothetical protein